MIKSYLVRIYPNKQQEKLMKKHVGCCRFIWNHMLGVQKQRYKDKEKHLSGFDMINLIKPLKNDGEHEWLKEVSNASLQTICRDLEKAYNAFFNGTSKEPKFKSKKRSKQSFPVRCDSLCFQDNDFLSFEKIGKVKYKTDFRFPLGRKACKFTNPRVTNRDGKWILSFGMECENQAYELTDKAMGIDLGIENMMIVAYGDNKIVFPNINKSKKMRNLEKKRKRLQRRVSRKWEMNKQGKKFIRTRNIEREQKKVNRLYARQTNIRNNYIHQCTHALVSLLPCRIVMEDLNVSGMMKNKHLSKAIQEQKFYEIIRQMQYKSEWCGIEFAQADRFYPSSKLCSNCGTINRNLKLRDRTFVCPDCGFTINRDYQAALNLSRYVS